MNSDVFQEAFEYAYALVEMGRLRAAQIGTGARPGRQALNTWHHMRKLSAAGDRWVTTPNADTLYSTLWLDLSQGPVRLHVPDTGGRYYSLAMMDMATNNFAIVGRRLTGTRAGSFVLVGPDWKEPLPSDARVISAPCRDVLVFMRILVQDDADLAAATALQDGFCVEPLGHDRGAVVNDWPSAASAPDGPEAFVEMAHVVLSRNPPPSYETAVLTRIAAAGIGPGLAWTSLPAETRAAWTRQWPAVNERLQRLAVEEGTTHNGWRYSMACAGQFGTDYAQRARTALRGLLVLENAEAFYAGSALDQFGEQLTGSNRYRLRIPSERLARAFWSLTMYQREADGRLFFVENPIARHAIGDRTRGLQWERDGSAEIWIQHEAPSDPAQRANWLPAPAGPFRLSLRAYEPTSDYRDGRVRLPAVERTVQGTSGPGRRHA